ncbi:hypothetical protein BD626DRAFT_480811, partial [Schizophyllum amplum]
MPSEDTPAALREDLASKGVVILTLYVQSSCALYAESRPSKVSIASGTAVLPWLCVARLTVRYLSPSHDVQSSVR